MSRSMAPEVLADHCTTLGREGTTLGREESASPDPPKCNVCPMVLPSEAAYQKITVESRSSCVVTLRDWGRVGGL